MKCLNKRPFTPESPIEDFVEGHNSIHLGRLPLLSERGGHPSLFRVHTLPWNS